jgi:hypothetical protein
MIKVFAVPKSMAMSLEKKSNRPMLIFFALNSIIDGCGSVGTHNFLPIIRKNTTLN